MAAIERQGIPYISVGLISGAALAYEVLLTRIFAIVHWHHLVATTISLALLGYGASGTFLALSGGRLMKYFAPTFIANALLFSLSSLLCVWFAQRIPFDPQALTWELHQALYLAAIFTVLAIPFFAAANCVGLALWRFPAQIPRLYGIDLLGAGVGAVALVAALSKWHPAHTLMAVSAIGLAVAVAASVALRWRIWSVTTLAMLIGLSAGIWNSVDIHPSAYKDIARSLAVQGAQIDHLLTGATGVVTVVRNEQVPLRSAPGLSLLARNMPPEQLAVFEDGDAAGGVLRSASGDPPAVLRDLTSALPYSILDRPRVVILNAGSGMAVLQALLHQAAHLDAVETNPVFAELACDTYADFVGDLCLTNRVDWHTVEPRSFLARSAKGFDLISVPANHDKAGLNSQQLDFSLTVQALTLYLQKLSPQGVVAIEGPTRLPPRLALRLVATASDALRQKGVAEPRQHIAMIRGWQRFALIVKRQPLNAAQQTAVRAFARERAFDLVWLPDMESAEANRYQRLAEPYFHDGVARLLGARIDNDERPYAYRLTPATDDRPYPYRFSRWLELAQLRRGGVQGSVSAIDTGFLVAVITLALATMASVLLILAPLLANRLVSAKDATRADRAWRWRTAVYFSLIGSAFLFVEIAWIQRLQLFLGHPVYATAFVLAVFLVFAGLGSLWCQRRGGHTDQRRLRLAVAGIGAISLLYLAGFDAWLLQFSHLTLAVRGLITITVLAPLAFLMGMPFPLGLRRISDEAGNLIPWAWGINGCTSVISAVVAPLLAMEIGISGLVVVGSLCYVTLLAVMPPDTAST